MLSTVRRKLRSQAGLSLSMSLLLFLVCMAVCSVVITAATAAGGRMSQLARMDQRYYSVTSAAELLCQHIDGKSVVFTSRKDGEENEEDALLSTLSAKLWDPDPEDVTKTKRISFTITPNREDLDTLKVTCEASYYRSPARGMTITVYNTTESPSEQQYNLKLDCTADWLESTAGSGDNKTTTYTVTWTVTGLSH